MLRQKTNKMTDKTKVILVCLCSIILIAGCFYFRLQIHQAYGDQTTAQQILTESDSQTTQDTKNISSKKMKDQSLFIEHFLSTNNQTKYIDGQWYLPLTSKDDGWFSDIEDNIYYFDSDYEKTIGWKTIDDKKYYFSLDGTLSTGWNVIEGELYRLHDETGEVLYGWHEHDGTKYYMLPDKGTPANNGALDIDGESYYFRSNGKMAIDETVDGFYYDANGVCTTPAAEREYIAKWEPRINSYLSGSPLAGQGRNFAKYAYQYDVDPRFSPAISCIESGKGAVCFKSHNAWGWGSSGYSSWEEAIRTHIKGLAEGYGGQLSMSGAQRYCPPNASSWYSKVQSEMNRI